MNLEEKRKYVEENSHKLTREELDFFKFNFACVYTRNSISIEHGKKELPIRSIMEIVRGMYVPCNEDLRRSVYNHYSAFLDLKIAAGKNLPLNEDLLKNTHASLTKGVTNTHGGLYRTVDISIKGSAHVPPSHFKVYDRMAKYFEAVEKETDDVIKLASFAHLQLAKIHPFEDGNGRLSRLMMNYVLMKNGYLPVSISVKRRMEYFALLEEYKVNKNPEPFENFLRELVNLEYDRLISLITIKNI